MCAKLQPQQISMQQLYIWIMNIMQHQNKPHNLHIYFSKQKCKHNFPDIKSFQISGLEGQVFELLSVMISQLSVTNVSFFVTRRAAKLR